MVANRNSSRSSINWSGADFRKAIPGAGVKLKLLVPQIMEYEANQAQNMMRTNAPWTDQTANARQGLFARYIHEGDNYTIVLYHTVPYGIWLEVRWSGKYAIIEPSLPLVGHNVMLSLNLAMRKLSAV